MRIFTYQVNPEVACDLKKSLITSLIEHETDADAHSTKTTGTTDSVEVGFGIRLTVVSTCVISLETIEQ